MGVCKHGRHKGHCEECSPKAAASKLVEEDGTEAEDDSRYKVQPIEDGMPGLEDSRGEESPIFVRLYNKPEEAGWLGWIEDATGVALGYIKLDGQVRWVTGVK